MYSLNFKTASFLRDELDAMLRPNSRAPESIEVSWERYKHTSNGTTKLVVVKSRRVASGWAMNSQGCLDIYAWPGADGDKLPDEPLDHFFNADRAVDEICGLFTFLAGAPLPDEPAMDLTAGVINAVGCTWDLVNAWRLKYDSVPLSPDKFTGLATKHPFPAPANTVRPSATSYADTWDPKKKSLHDYICCKIYSNDDKWEMVPPWQPGQNVGRNSIRSEIYTLYHEATQLDLDPATSAWPDMFLDMALRLDIPITICNEISAHGMLSIITESTWPNNDKIFSLLMTKEIYRARSILREYAGQTLPDTLKFMMGY